MAFYCYDASSDRWKNVCSVWSSKIIIVEQKSINSSPKWNSSLNDSWDFQGEFGSCNVAGKSAETRQSFHKTFDRTFPIEPTKILQNRFKIFHVDEPKTATSWRDESKVLNCFNSRIIWDPLITCFTCEWSRKSVEVEEETRAESKGMRDMPAPKSWSNLSTLSLISCRALVKQRTEMF